MKMDGGGNALFTRSDIDFPRSLQSKDGNTQLETTEFWQLDDVN